MPTDKTDSTADVPSVSDALDALMAENEPAPVEEPVAEPAKEPDTELDPAPEPEPEPEPEAEPAAVDADELAALAEEAVSFYGLSQEEVDKAGEMLPWLLARMDKQASALMQGQAPEQAPPAEQEPAAKQEPEKKAQPLADLPTFELPINRDDFDEGSLKVFDAMKDEINTQRSTINEHRKAMQMLATVLTETHQTAAQLRQQTETASTSEFANSMDDFFANLPDEYADIYGKQPMSQLAPNSPMVATRNALVREMEILKGFDAKGGRPARATKEQAARTLRALHADKAHVVARREVDKQLKTRAAKGIARPSGRSNKKPMDLASRKVRAMAAMDGPLARLLQ